jgi:hypothetical protein
MNCAEVSFDEDCMLGCDVVQTGRYLPTFKERTHSASVFVLTPKMQATGISISLVTAYQTTWSHIPEDRHLQNHSCENLELPY